MQGTKRALAHSQMRVGDALGEYPSGCTGPYYRVPKTGQKRVRCVSKERSDWSLAVYTCLRPINTLKRKISIQTENWSQM